MNADKPLLESLCIDTADDRRSWKLRWIFSDGREEDAEFPATAEGTEELLDVVRDFTAGRVKRRN
jgi:hypothetical protein